MTPVHSLEASLRYIKGMCSYKRMARADREVIMRERCLRMLRFTPALSDLVNEGVSEDAFASVRFCLSLFLPKADVTNFTSWGAINDTITTRTGILDSQGGLLANVWREVTALQGCVGDVLAFERRAHNGRTTSHLDSDGQLARVGQCV